MSFRMQHIESLNEYSMSEVRVLSIMCRVHDESKSGPNAEVFKDIYITNESLAKILGMTMDGIIKITRKLILKGALMNSKSNALGKNHWDLHIKKIEDLHVETLRINEENIEKEKQKLSLRKTKSLAKKSTLDQRPAPINTIPASSVKITDTRLASSPDTRLASSDDTIPASSPDTRRASSQSESYQNFYKNNYHKGNYYLKNDFKIDDMAHAKRLLHEKFNLMLANNELPSKYKKTELVTEILFSLQEAADLTNGFNMAINLVLVNRWDVPLKMQIERAQQAKKADQEQANRYYAPVAANHPLSSFFGAFAKQG